VSYTDPDYPDRWLAEEVRVTGDDPPRLVINDTGGECANGSEVVPVQMNPGDAACYHVCHRVYHVMIYWPFADNPPITVSPGCYGPEVDRCTFTPECVPGGTWDYQWTLIPGDVYWHLEFEYSNPHIEPVCFCVEVGMPPCEPVTNLVIYYDYSELQAPTMSLFWTAPQAGNYLIFSTVNPNNNGQPPGPGWVLEATVSAAPGPASWSRSFVPGQEPNYRNFVIICDCQPANGLKK